MRYNYQRRTGLFFRAQGFYLCPTSPKVGLYLGTKKPHSGNCEASINIYNMNLKRKSRLTVWKAQLELLVQALTVIEKLRALLAPVLTLVLSKGKTKMLITLVTFVVKISLLFFEP